MNAFPEVIYDEILSYLSYENHVPFASMNVMLSKILLKRVRRILIREEDQVELYFSSQIFRDEIHSLIVDPYEQLKVETFLNPVIEGVDIVTCKELTTTAEIFVDSFMSHVNKLHSLTIRCGGFIPVLINETIINKTLRIVYQQMYNSQPSY